MQDVVKDEVVRVACAEGLVTPHTAAVGVLLRSSPADASQAAEAEVPLQVSHPLSSFLRGVMHPRMTSAVTIPYLAFFDYCLVFASLHWAVHHRPVPFCPFWCPTALCLAAL